MRECVIAAVCVVIGGVAAVAMGFKTTDLGPLGTFFTSSSPPAVVKVK